MENINIASFDFDDAKIHTKLDELTQQIEDLNIQREKEKKQLSELGKEYNANAKQMDILAKTGKQNSQQYADLASKQEELIKSTVRQRQQISDTTTEIRGLTNESKQLNQVLDFQEKATLLLSNAYDAESRSIDQLREDRKILLQLRNQEVAVMGEQSEQAQKLNRVIEESTEGQQDYRFG